MENEFREKQQKSYNRMRTIYDVTMALLFLGVAFILLLGDKIGNAGLSGFVAGFDNDYGSAMRFIFGGICALYGGFRIYRGIKHNY